MHTDAWFSFVIHERRQTLTRNKDEYRVCDFKFQYTVLKLHFPYFFFIWICNPNQAHLKRNSTDSILDMESRTLEDFHGRGLSSPCLSRWTCEWSVPLQVCDRIQLCRTLVSGLDGHWIGEDGSPKWHRPENGGGRNAKY